MISCPPPWEMINFLVMEYGRVADATESTLQNQDGRVDRGLFGQDAEAHDTEELRIRDEDGLEVRGRERLAHRPQEDPAHAHQRLSRSSGGYLSARDPETVHIGADGVPEMVWEHQPGTDKYQHPASAQCGMAHPGGDRAADKLSTELEGSGNGRYPRIYSHQGGRFVQIEVFGRGIHQNNGVREGTEGTKDSNRQGLLGGDPGISGREADDSPGMGRSPRVLDTPPQLIDRPELVIFHKLDIPGGQAGGSISGIGYLPAQDQANHIKGDVLPGLPSRTVAGMGGSCHLGADAGLYRDQRFGYGECNPLQAGLSEQEENVPFSDCPDQLQRIDYIKLSESLASTRRYRKQIDSLIKQVMVDTIIISDSSQIVMEAMP